MSIYYNGKEFPINYMAREKEYIGVDLGSIGYSSDDILDLWKDGLEYAKEIKENWDSSITYMSGKYENNKNLVFFPKVDTSKVTRLSSCFKGCSNLLSIPKLDISNVTDIGYYFYECTSLTTIPQLDTSNVTDMGYCFYGCRSLTTIPQLDTSNVTDMGNCFYQCSNLLSIPQLDTSNVTTMSNCFYGCTSLTTIPELNTRNVTTMGYCFYNCTSLTRIPELNTSNVTNMSYMLLNCSKLKRIEGISFKSMGSISSSSSFIFGSTSNTSCSYLLIKDIGTNSSCTTFDTTNARKWGVNDEVNPDARQSLIDSLLTYSFDRASAGYSNCTIKLYSTVKALLTTDEINQIQAKGYIIS